MQRYFGQYLAYETEEEIMFLPGKAGDVAYAFDTKLRYMSNGSSWFPTDALRVIRGTAVVDLRAAAATKILTLPPTSYRFVVLGAHVEVTELTGSIVTQPSLSVGTNSSSYNNLFTNTGLAGLLTAVGLTSSNSLSLASAAPALPGASDVYAKVNVGPIGVGLTAYKARIDLMGYFEI